MCLQIDSVQYGKLEVTIAISSAEERNRTIRQTARKQLTQQLREVGHCRLILASRQYFVLLFTLSNFDCTVGSVTQTLKENNNDNAAYVSVNVTKNVDVPPHVVLSGCKCHAYSTHVSFQRVCDCRDSTITVGAAKIRVCQVVVGMIFNFHVYSQFIMT